MKRAAVTTLPPTAPFIDSLARGLIARAGGDRAALADTLILLPTRRAVRALRDAFLRLGEGSAAILPRMQPLGDIDAEELTLRGGLEALPPAIRPLRRQLVLTRLVMAGGGLAATVEQAAALADSLALLLDQLQTERVDAEALAAIVPEDLAAHWQRTLDFLRIATRLWPQVLAGEGALDPAAWRNAVLEAQAAWWRAHPPNHPVIAAGITGSIPAAADLLAVVAGLPQGEVVLPGLDTELDEEAWEALGESHPQYGLKRLLAALGIGRDTVGPWRGQADENPARTRLISEIFRPAETAERWQAMRLPAGATDGLSRLSCADQQEEAEAIALMLRETLETPGRTAALITPDRALAARVSVALKRWGITVNDSGGRPLSAMPVGVFLALIGRAAVSRLAPVETLSLLKHPLAGGGRSPAAFRRLARALELAIYRGPRPGGGFAAMRAALHEAEEHRFGRRTPRADLSAWVDQLEAMLGPLCAAVAARDVLPLPVWIERHLAAAEALAAAEGTPGAARLWRREDGECAANLFDSALRGGGDFPALTGEDYFALLDRFLDQAPVRPILDVHPRLAILGLMEARLQQFDRIVIGGVNDGRFPSLAAADPWLSRPMQRAIGLPTPDRAIGQQAHDFALALGAREVILTRARWLDGAPARPSRWWLRLETLLRATQTQAGDDGARLWSGWAAALHRPPGPARPARRPEPRPPVALRPRALSVTEIETWVRDPYSLYARHILKLRPLDPIDADADAAERGQFIHAALDAFMRAHPKALPEDALARLLAFGEAAFGDRLARPDIRAFWWPRFERIAAWFVSGEAARRRDIETSETEIRGRRVLEAPGGPFTLRAKADRIDRRRDGSAIIIDYKTGTVPADTEIQAGFSPQLPLEGWIAAGGGFGTAFTVGEYALEHWKLSGGEPAGLVMPIDGNMTSLIEAAGAGLAALIARFDLPTTPYIALPRPGRAPRYAEYVLLARRDEWRQADPEAS